MARCPIPDDILRPLAYKMFGVHLSKCIVFRQCGYWHICDRKRKYLVGVYRLCVAPRDASGAYL